MDKRNWLRIGIRVVLGCVFVFSAYKIIDHFVQQHTATQLDTSLQAAVSVQSLSPTAKPTVPSASRPEEQSTPPSSQQPTVSIAVDFAALRKTAPDVIGWLYIPDTPINYPVVQGENNDTYLHTLPNGQHNDAGSLFADYRNAGVSDRNFLIYGHSMKNGTRFGTLEHYAKQEYFNGHPVAYYVTPEATYLIHIYAGYTTAANSDAYVLYQTEEELADYMAKAKSRSDFQSTVTYRPGNTVVTLSTCAYDYEGARYVLLGIPEKVG